MKKNPVRKSEPTDHEIATCAYLIWEAEGRPHGRAPKHWFQAKKQLAATHRLDAVTAEETDPIADKKMKYPPATKGSSFRKTEFAASNL